MPEKLKELFPGLKATNRPSVVWFIDVSDDKTNKKIEAIFQSEPIGLALKRFNCFKLNILELPEGRLKERYVKLTPSFNFFDPAADPIGKPLAGKRAASLSSFSSYVERTWNTSFTMRMKEFTKKMKDILDRLDKVANERTRIEKDKERLAKKPNKAKKRRLEEEEAKLKEVMAKIEEDEKAIIESCALRPEFLPVEEVGAK